jgi:hypothetical protein
MANTLTPEQFEQACKNAIVSVEKNISKILINTTNIGSADMQSRIFDEGKTVAGNTMRYRSAPYKKLRVDAGLQVNHKDLEFTGDLFFSMSILSTAQNEVAYGFNNNRTAEIAGCQEESRQVGEPIFELSEKEAKLMERQFAIDVAKVFKGALEDFPNMPSVSNIGKSATNKSIARNKAKKKSIKKVKSKRDIETQYAKRKSTVEKTKQTIQKRQTEIDKTRARLAKAKTPEAKQKIQDSLNKKRAKLQETKQRVTKQVVARRKTRAKMKRITGK